MELITIPNWRRHLKTAKTAGIGPTIAKDITRLLDNPTDKITGRRLPHKSIHNKKGLIMAYMLHGKTGLRLAMIHMLEDRISESIKKKYSGKGITGEIISELITQKTLDNLGKIFHKESVYDL